MTRAKLALFLTSLLVLACKRTPPPPPPPVEPCTPDLASVEAQVFERSCALAECHNPRDQAGRLVLAKGTDLAKSLFGVPSAACPDKIRVVPGDPDKSYLYQKITGVTSGCGTGMPPGLPLKREAVMCVREWIASLPPAP